MYVERVLRSGVIIIMLCIFTVEAGNCCLYVFYSNLNTKLGFQICTDSGNVYVGQNSPDMFVCLDRRQSNIRK